MCAVSPCLMFDTHRWLICTRNWCLPSFFHKRAHISALPSVWLAKVQHTCCLAHLSNPGSKRVACGAPAPSTTRSVPTELTGLRYLMFFSSHPPTLEHPVVLQLHKMKHAALGVLIHFEAHRRLWHGYWSTAPCRNHCTFIGTGTCVSTVLTVSCGDHFNLIHLMLHVLVITDQNYGTVKLLSWRIHIHCKIARSCCVRHKNAVAYISQHACHNPQGLSQGVSWVSDHRSQMRNMGPQNLTHWQLCSVLCQVWKNGGFGTMGWDSAFTHCHATPPQKQTDPLSNFLGGEEPLGGLPSSVRRWHDGEILMQRCFQQLSNFQPVLCPVLSRHTCCWSHRCKQTTPPSICIFCLVFWNG